MESKDKKKEKGKINVKEYLSKNKGIFTRELKKMMYGFGDVINPDTDSVECMEDLLMEFITEMCLEASKVSAPRVRVKTEDFLFVLRHDEKKLARAEELLIMAKDIARARKLIAEGTEVAYTAKE